ncbi:hypothetical protein HDU67_006936, partial [Dinochytrium kinnereticum]
GFIPATQEISRASTFTQCNTQCALQSPTNTNYGLFQLGSEHICYCFNPSFFLAGGKAFNPASNRCGPCAPRGEAGACGLKVDSRDTSLYVFLYAVERVVETLPTVGPTSEGPGPGPVPGSETSVVETVITNPNPSITTTSPSNPPPSGDLRTTVSNGTTITYIETATSSPPSPPSMNPTTPRTSPPSEDANSTLLLAPATSSSGGLPSPSSESRDGGVAPTAPGTAVVVTVVVVSMGVILSAVFYWLCVVSPRMRRERLKNLRSDVGLLQAAVLVRGGRLKEFSSGGDGAGGGGGGGGGGGVVKGMIVGKGRGKEEDCERMIARPERGAGYGEGRGRGMSSGTGVSVGTASSDGGDETTVV